jgi:hypothetical protein
VSDHFPGFALRHPIPSIRTTVQPATMDEKLKEQLMPAVIVFCWTIIGYVVITYFFLSTAPWYFGDFMVQALIGAGIGIVTGGATLGIMAVRK